MNANELQIEVAKEMGWTDIRLESWDCDLPDEMAGFNPKLNCRMPVGLSFYATSLGAIQAAVLEKFITENDQRLFDEALCMVFINRKVDYVWQLTAADWCEAFLATCEEMRK